MFCLSLYKRRMLKACTFCLLSFVFGNSFLLATATKEQPVSTKDPKFLIKKPATLIKKTTKSTKKETTLTDEEIQKIRSAREAMYEKIINTLKTKPYVEGINEVYKLLCEPISVSGYEAMERYKVPLIRAVLQWLYNTIKNPSPKDKLTTEERVNQAVFIVITLYRLNSNKLVHFFQRYIGSFWVYPGINDDQVKEIVIDKLSELKKQAKLQGIKYWLIKCIDDQLYLLRNDRYQRAIIFI